MYNEEATIERFCEEIMLALRPVINSYDLELVLVDDGSVDLTPNKMRELRDRYPKIITIVQLSRNFGLDAAIYAGIQVGSGDAVIAMDADLQDPPSVILKMIREWENGADVVVGMRISRPNDSFFKRISAKIFYHLLNSLSGKLVLAGDAANFRLLNRKAVKAFLTLPEVSGVFRVMVPFIGMSTSVVAYERDKRFSGKTKFHLKSMIRYALDSLTGISIEPLRKIPITIFFALMLAVISGAGMLILPPQWGPSLLICLALSSLFTLLFIVLSIIGEYLCQIYIQVQGRPTAIIYDVKRSESACRRNFT